MGRAINSTILAFALAVLIAAFVLTWVAYAAFSSVASTSGNEVSAAPLWTAQTTLTTTGPVGATAGVAIAGSMITATLSGTNSKGASGTITFSVFGPQPSAPTTCTSGGTTFGSAIVSGAGAYHPSASYTTSNVGTYWWYASYGGAPGNSVSASTCGSGMSSTFIAKATTTTSADAPATGSTGVAIAGSSVSSTLSGATGAAAGTITFTVFGPQASPPSTCTNGGSTAGSATVSGSGTYHPGGTYTPTSPGTYWWYASYNGDSNNSSSASVCGGGMTSTVVTNPFGAAAKLVFTTQPVGGVTEGTNLAIEPVVKVEDASGNVVTNDSGSVTLAIRSGPSAGSLSCTNSSFPTVTAVAGVASFTGCQITGTAAAGSYTLEATRGGLSATGASSNVVINVGSANKLAFTTQPSGGTISTAWSQQPVVSIEDSYGNVVTTVGSTSITLSLSTGSGTLSCTSNPVSTTSGVSTFAGCKINATGTEDVLTASGTYPSATSNKFKILATPAVSEVAKGFASAKTVTSSSFTPISGDKYLIFAAHTSSSGDSASLSSGAWSSATAITSQHLGDGISWQWAWIATANTNSSSTATVEFAKETTKTGMGKDDNIIEVLQLTNANENEAVGGSALTAGETTSHDQLSANLPTVAAGGSDVVFVYVAGDTSPSDTGWVNSGISTVTSAATTYEHSGGPGTGFGTLVGFAASALSGSATYGHSESWPAPTGTKYGTIALGIAPQ